MMKQWFFAFPKLEAFLVGAGVEWPCHVPTYIPESVLSLCGAKIYISVYFMLFIRQKMNVLTGYVQTHAPLHCSMQFFLHVE